MYFFTNPQKHLSDHNGGIAQVWEAHRLKGGGRNDSAGTVTKGNVHVSTEGAIDN